MPKAGATERGWFGSPASGSLLVLLGGGGTLYFGCVCPPCLVLEVDESPSERMRAGADTGGGVRVPSMPNGGAFATVGTPGGGALLGKEARGTAPAGGDTQALPPSAQPWDRGAHGGGSDGDGGRKFFRGTASSGGHRL